MGVWQDLGLFDEVRAHLWLSRPQYSTADIPMILQAASLLVSNRAARKEDGAKRYCQSVVGIISIIVYQRYFHPLAGFPGPFWSSVTTV
jgi:hypothetical protein